MLPVGLGISAASERALQATKTAKLPRKYYDWNEIKPGEQGRMRFAGTAPSHLFYAMREGQRMLLEEGLVAVFDRHPRLPEATRRAVRAGGRGNGPTRIGQAGPAQLNPCTAGRQTQGF